MCRMPDDLITRTDPDAVMRFTARLAELHPDDWLAAAAAAAHDAPARATAYAVMEALIAHHGLGVEAWYARDAVETAAYSNLGQAVASARSRQAATQRHVARSTANAAALSLLMRPLLATDDFELLYRPFAALVPA